MKKRITVFSALLASLAVIITSVLITLSSYNNFFNNVKQEVKVEASYIESGIKCSSTDYLNSIDFQSGHRVTLINSDGSVLFDNMSDPKTMDNHLNREEIQMALQNKTGEITRFSDTINEQTYYYALLLDDSSILRMGTTTASIVAFFNQNIWLVLLISAVIIIICILLARLLTKYIVKPINNIDLDKPENNKTYDELVPLLTRIKKQHIKIDEQIKQLGKQRTEFNTVTQNMSEGFLILNKDGKILSYNNSALSLLNVKTENPSGQNILTLNRSPVFRDIVENALSGEEQERILIDGRHCQVFASPVKDKNKLRGVMLLLMDVTEKEEREKLRREFTSNVSHELKTPLTAISGYAEIITGGVAKSEDIPEFSAQIYHEAQRMISLINDLMLLSKLEESAPPPSEQVNLFEIAENVISMLSQKAEKHGITLSIEGQAQTILGIPSILDEMIYNLVDNAIKYNHYGGNVTITVSKDNNNTILSVTDTGNGIEQNELERIFERFYRIDKSRNEKIEGTGLGLAIVKHGASIHNAKIEVTSDKNGSTFSLRFCK